MPSETTNPGRACPDCQIPRLRWQHVDAVLAAAEQLRWTWRHAPDIAAQAVTGACSEPMTPAALRAHVLAELERAVAVATQPAPARQPRWSR